MVEGHHCELIIGDERVNIWQWSRQVHDTCLHRAGLTDIRRRPPEAPPGAPAVADAMASYRANPSCLVRSARKPGQPSAAAPSATNQVRISPLPLTSTGPRGHSRGSPAASC